MNNLIKYKIFEDKNIKYWFVFMIDNKDVEVYHEKLKQHVDNMYFYESSNTKIFCLIHVTNETIEEINFNYPIKCTNDIKRKLDENDDGIIPDIEKWIKLNKNITTYNI